MFLSHCSRTTWYYQHMVDERKSKCCHCLWQTMYTSRPLPPTRLLSPAMAPTPLSSLQRLRDYNLRWSAIATSAMVARRAGTLPVRYVRMIAMALQNVRQPNPFHKVTYTFPDKLVFLYIALFGVRACVVPLHRLINSPSSAMSLLSVS